MLRGAIIGLGNVAVHGGHLAEWGERDDVEIVAGTDVRAARRAELERRLPRARWYDSPGALLEGEALDFVDICTPPATHADLIRAALDQGCHVLCEKPLVRPSDDLAALVRLAARADRVLHTVHNWHHAPIIRRTRELLRGGEIGEIRHVEWRTLRTQPAAIADEASDNWRLDPELAGGGVLMDHGWHVFYVLLGWVGTAPTAVRARLQTRRHTRWAVEDTATVEIRFGEATAGVFLTWASDVRGNAAEIAGTTGTIRVEDGTLVLRRTGRGECRWPCPPPLSSGSIHPDWFQRVASDFIGEVSGRPRSGENLREATICAALQGAARESHRRGALMLPVAAPPVPVRAGRGT